ncbi:MAG: tetratricopeptide repeat protein [PVC group bacterium]|nr:tetratricopeptide repeat protein [PVC group bacterium]
MNKIVIFIVLGVVAAAFLGAAIFFYSENKKLEVTVSQQQKIAESLKEELDRVKEITQKHDKEKEKIRSESVSYIDLNNKLQSDNAQIAKDMAKSARQMKEQDAQIEELKKQLKNKEEEPAPKEEIVKPSEKEKLEKQIESLKEKLNAQEEALNKERAIFQYNLGVAYSKAKLFNEAVDALNKSLELEEENPEANYNLGVIYQKARRNPARAIFYYKKYLELSPEAADRIAVQREIDSLGADMVVPLDFK